MWLLTKTLRSNPFDFWMCIWTQCQTWPRSSSHHLVFGRFSAVFWSMSSSGGALTFTELVLPFHANHMGCSDARGDFLYEVNHCALSHTVWFPVMTKDLSNRKHFRMIHMLHVCFSHLGRFKIVPLVSMEPHFILTCNIFEKQRSKSKSSNFVFLWGLAQQDNEDFARLRDLL